jgi:hypothetical protein
MENPDDLTVLDLLLAPLYIFFAWIIANIIGNKNVYTNPEYKYFTQGLMVKIAGAIGLGLVYAYYYGGGDTFNYYETARAYVNLFLKNREAFFEGWLSPSETYDYYQFDDTTGYPVYFHRDANAFFVVRLLIPILALSFNSYFACCVLMACISYTGIWKLYQTFLKQFPTLKKEFAIAILFIPSCVFWGSGLMKDSFTLSAVGWYTYAFYNFFIARRRKIMHVIEMLIAATILVAIKPYIFFALLPGSIIWLSNQWITKISNKTFRLVLGPAFLAIGISIAYLGLTQMGDFLGIYRVETVLERASVVQKDMKAEYYGGNAFDIGDFDADIGSVFSKAPIAIFSGIFRPGIWDVKNVVMFISSLENTYLLLLAVFLLIRLKFLGFFSLIWKNPMLLFSMLFSLFFAFSVGLTVANFGSLVRLRIPELPFFVSGLFILRYFYEQKSGKKVRI